MRIKPHKTIGVDYLERWHLFPRNRWLNVYLHKFSGNDDDRALHDHPWSSLSFVLRGKLAEVYRIPGTDKETSRDISNWRFVYRPAEFAHRLELRSSTAWTLFITGRKVREWGFLCPKGWIHWSKITTADGQTIGGCDG